MKLLILSLVLALNCFAQLQIPALNSIKAKAVENLETEDDPQLMELTDVKIKIPTSGSADSEKCIFLIHADHKLKTIHEAAARIDNLIENNAESCSLIKEAKIQKNKLTKDNKWNFSFHFGFSRTKYHNTDMRLKSSRIDVLIKDFEIDERTSAGFYNPTNWEKFGDAFRWIDEPTNHFIITAEKNNHSIILSIFHPKFLKKQYQNKHVIGTVDGVAVDDLIDINEEFDGYNNQVGEMYLVRFENTHMQMAWSVGYGYDIKLFNSEKAGALSIRPTVYIGAMTGQNYSVYVQEGEYWEFDDGKDKNRIQGLILTGGLRLNYRIKNFNFFVDGQYSRTHLNHGFMDGTAEYNLTYTPLTFGIGYTFDFSKNKKKRKTPPKL